MKLINKVGFLQAIEMSNLNHYNQVSNLIKFVNRKLNTGNVLLTLIKYKFTVEAIIKLVNIFNSENIKLRQIDDLRV